MNLLSVPRELIELQLYRSMKFNDSFRKFPCDKTNLKAVHVLLIIHIYSFATQNPFLCIFHVMSSWKFLVFSFSASDCLGRRLGPRLLGRVDDSEVSYCFFSDYKKLQVEFLCIIYVKLSLILFLLQQRLVRDFYKILNEVSTQEIPDGLKLPDSFHQLVSDMKNNHYDAKTFSIVLRAMVHSLI